ncbi:MAG: hypothetical protein FI688_00210 [SAR202 cluster bacterium]|nr:hypothetical protein [SAR202 cluster bacterium]
MTTALSQSTYKISNYMSLKNMVLKKNSLPNELEGFELLRESELDNTTMAMHGFPGSSEEIYQEAGRITGYMREFCSPSAIPQHKDGSDIVAATIVHLFEDESSPSNWMENIFIKQFNDNVGKTVGDDQRLVAVEQLEIDDFYDKSVGIRAVQDGQEGTLSTTIIDFCIGRLLGVTFVVTVGDHGRTELTTMLGLELERSIVKELLATESNS